jgi:hypothetical protein
MDLKVIPERNGRYTLWSTRVEDALLEAATREELVTYYCERKPDGSAADIEALIDRADGRRPGRPGAHSYEEAREFLSGE